MTIRPGGGICRDPMIGSIHARTLMLSCLLGVALCSCVKSRFMNCQTDPDCAPADSSVKNEKPFCENLRCVECRNAKDCGVNETCNLTTKQCQSLR
jgi:hypothetical protein